MSKKTVETKEKDKEKVKEKPEAEEEKVEEEAVEETVIAKPAKKKAEKKKKIGKKIFTYYKLGDEITRLRPFCERCGQGYFMADHGDRYTCGHCGFSRYKQTQQ